MALPNFVLENASELRESIVRHNVRDVVAGKIATLIASGMLQIGDELPSERDLASALQVSRETVRGGIQILAAKNLVAVLHGARTRVIGDEVSPEFEGIGASRLINSYGLGEIHAARLFVERQVVGDAAERIDDATLRQLDDSLTAQRTSLDDPVRFLIIDREFHLAVYRGCGNRVLADFVGNLYGYMMAHRRKAVSEPGAILRSYGDHVAIVRALKSRKRKAAIQAIEAHLTRIYETTLTMLESPEASRASSDG
ncbi:MAG: FadR family transcriptional regulator [Proteobacteria bacterium]|nr:FadR family transcriptional regulator [Pseudomonadota bacterium]